MSDPGHPPEPTPTDEEVLFVDTPPPAAEPAEEPEDLPPPAPANIRFSIRLKLGLSLAVLLVASLLLLASTLLHQQSRHLVAEMESRARILSSGLAANLKEGFDDPLLRHPIVAETAAEVKDLLLIRVYDNHAFLVDSSDAAEFAEITRRIAAEEEPRRAPPDLIDRLTRLNRQEQIDHPDRIRFTVLQPVTVGRTVVGYAVLDFTRRLILDRVAQARRSALLIVGLAIALGLAAFFVLLTAILAPIKRLVLGLRQLAEKPIRKVRPVHIRTADEFEWFGAEFNDMVRKLQEAEEEKEKKRRLEREIEIGRELQQNLLPESFPSSPAFAFDAYYRPKSGMGGDYYDILQIDPRTVGVIIADVCGKGVPAAIIMVIIRTIFHSVARFVDKPSKALDIINRNIAGRTAGEKYATMLYYMLHTDTGILEYANAAQPSLLIYHRRLGQVREYGNEETPPHLRHHEVVGAPVGARPDTVYFDLATRVEDGDVIVLATDGITEAMNAQHELYDENALKRDLAKFAHLSATEIKDRIIASVEAFTAGYPPNDDRTLLVLKVTSVGGQPTLSTSSPAHPSIPLPPRRPTTTTPPPQPHQPTKTPPAPPPQTPPKPATPQPPRREVRIIHPTRPTTTSPPAQPPNRPSEPYPTTTTPKHPTSSEEEVLFDDSELQEP